MTSNDSSGPSAARVLALFVVVAALGWMDYRTGPDIGFSLFYLVPVIAAAWFVGGSSALVVALSAAGAWFVADLLLRPTSLLVTIWNAATRLIIYAALGALVTRLREEKRRLERANAELDAFSHSVSHDLRSPLIQIGRYAEMIERQSASLGEDGRHLVSTIAHTAAEGLKLVDDLLEFAQIAKTDIRRAAVNLSSVVAKIQGELIDLEESRKVDWKIAPLPVVRGDGPLLEVALRNLIGNALKFTRPRERAVIEVGSLADDDGTVIYVRDNGVGFDPEYAPKLFGVFERLHGRNEFEGSGIGLALVQRIVSRHGGRVWAEGAVDRGATFYVKLPEKR